MEKANRKRMIIIFVYIFLFIFLVFSVFVFSSPAPSCSDGKKNQNEKGIDCGGVCLNECEEIKTQDLIVGVVGETPAGLPGKFDFYAQVTNPNAVFGAENFNYKIIFKDGSGTEIAERIGSAFILPGEKKYIIENNIESEVRPVDFSFEIFDLQWKQFNDYYEKPNIQIVNRNYSEISGGVGFSEAKGLLKNESTFDFETIKIQVILKDADGKIVALNSTQMKTVESGEARDFRVFWPNSFPGAVSNMEAQAEVNVFKSDTFLKKFYRTERFQEQ
jgi:hypothetical protein